MITRYDSTDIIEWWVKVKNVILLIVRSLFVFYNKNHTMFPSQFWWVDFIDCLAVK